MHLLVVWLALAQLLLWCQANVQKTNYRLATVKVYLSLFANTSVVLFLYIYRCKIKRHRQNIQDRWTCSVNCIERAAFVASIAVRRRHYCAVSLFCLLHYSISHISV